MIERGLGGQQQAQHVDVELLVEVLGRDPLDGAEFVDAGVIDQRIDGAEFARHLLHKRPDGIRIGQVPLHRDRLAARCRDFSDELFRRGLAA